MEQIEKQDTEFTIESVKQVIIQDLIHENMENFLHQCYVKGVVSTVWVDGVIIDPKNCIFRGDQEYRNVTNGIKFYEKLVFVKYQKYTKSVKWNGGNYELNLLNYNNHPRFRALAKWIKSQPVWEIKSEGIK